MFLCYKARHQLNLSQADEGRSLQLHFADVSRIAGDSPLTSRSNFPDLRQLSPHEPSLTEHGGRVRVVGEPRRRSSVVRKLNRFLKNKSYKSAHLCSGPKRFCGLTVPNYPGPSVITSSSNSIVLSYNLPADSLVQGHSFQVEKKNFAIPKLNVPTRTTGCSERRQPTLLCHVLHPRVWQ